MRYGEEYKQVLVDKMTKNRFESKAVYRHTEWKDYHTDDNGYGLWKDGKQILGTMQFSVAGCKTEKAAKAKIRKYHAEMVGN